MVVMGRQLKFKPLLPSSEITPEHIYLSRRKALRLGALGAGAAVLSACAPVVIKAPTTAAPTVPVAAGAKSDTPAAAAKDYRDEQGDPANSYLDITTYNNFYEFTTDKEGVAAAAANFKTSPWTVTVSGLVNKPATFDLDDLRKRFGEEERIYRLRCVEAWSMVIPWQGFTLAKLLKEVEPKAEAKYVRFSSLADAAQMPGVNSPFYSWPYVEGLRMDEAMHDLSFLATGLYGKTLPPQNGAPIRLAVPWKYGFKSIKSIVKIELVSEQPTSLWMSAAPDEYGFYSNVNPQKSHPRWSQASERRIGESSRRRTQMYNGYAAQVASLYTGMDLDANY
jgi:sulfoxide reductase catalytic subunit YedY